MPYASDKKLDNLVKQVLQDDDIQKGVKDANLSESFLSTEARHQAKNIWAAASMEISEYDSLENELAFRQKGVESSLPAKPKPYEGWAEYPPTWAMLVSLIFLPLILFGFLFSYFCAQLAIIDTLSNSKFVVVGFYILLPASIVLGFYYLLRRRRWNEHLRQRKKSEEERQKWENAKADAEKRGGISEIVAKLGGVEKKIDEVLLEKTIKDVMRLKLDPALPEIPKKSAHDLLLELTGIDLSRCPRCQKGTMIVVR